MVLLWYYSYKKSEVHLNKCSRCIKQTAFSEQKNVGRLDLRLFR